MKKAHKLVLIFLSLIGLAWLIPVVYCLIIPDKNRDPFVAWSPVSNRFIVSMPTDGKDDPEIFDIDPITGKPGKYWNKEQRDSLLPEIYTSQLMGKGLMPDSLNGEEMSMQNIRRNRWTFSSFPENINKSVPEIYPLMESMPARFDLEDPKVALIAKNKVDIVDIASNSTDKTKTERFGRMFEEKGFRLPVIKASANITTRKGYDNGYLLIDADNNIYHLKMQVNRPSMAKINRPDSVIPTNVFIQEQPDKAFYGFVSTTSGDFYAIQRDDYSMIKIPEVKFNPATDRMSILKGLFSWVIKLEKPSGYEWIAINSDNYGFIDKYEYSQPKTLRKKLADIASLIKH